MKRRDFVRVLGGAVVTGAAISTVACGGDDGGGGGADAMVSANCGTQISANHGHTMTVAQVDVDAGVEKSYDISGSSGHSHTVVVTAANMTTLQGGQSVTITSSTDVGHSHMVTVSC